MRVNRNLCEGGLKKQRTIDRLKQGIQSLREKVPRLERKGEQGPFGSATPSAKIPVKANTAEEQSSKPGGAKPGHRGHGPSGSRTRNPASSRCLTDWPLIPPKSRSPCCSTPVEPGAPVLSQPHCGPFRRCRAGPVCPYVNPLPETEGLQARTGSRPENPSAFQCAPISRPRQDCCGYRKGCCNGCLSARSDHARLPPRLHGGCGRRAECQERELPSSHRLSGESLRARSKGVGPSLSKPISV